MTDQLAIGALGSCRVHTPLKILASAGKIKFKPDSVVGYLHNPLEMIQAVKLLKGENKSPVELADLMNIKAPDRLDRVDRFTGLFTDADLFVVEISSIRIIELHGWQLQINRVRELLKSHGLNGGDVRKLFNPDFDRTAIIGKLTNSPSALAVDLIENGHFHELRGVPLVSALADLRGLLQMPVVFVGSVTQKFDGTPIDLRVRIKGGLQWLAQDQEDTLYIDPTRLVEKHGIEVCMADLSHYRTEFEPEVARYILRELRRFAAGSKEVSRRVARRQQRDELRASRRTGVA